MWWRIENLVRYLMLQPIKSLSFNFCAQLWNAIQTNQESSMQRSFESLKDEQKMRGKNSTLETEWNSKSIQRIKIGLCFSLYRDRKVFQMKNKIKSDSDYSPTTNYIFIVYNSVVFIEFPFRNIHIMNFSFVQSWWLCHHDESEFSIQKSSKFRQKIGKTG